MYKAAMIAASAAAVLGAGDVHTQPYLYADVDGRGPKDWGKIKDKDGKLKYEVCETGKRQSPINLHQAQIDADLKPLEFHYTTAKGLSLTNNHHSVNLIPDNNGGNYLLDPNQGNKRYNLLGIHFHAPSEHAIGHGLYDLEMHMVHQEADSNVFGEPLLVVGTMFNAGSTPNDAFEFFSNLPGLDMTGFDNLKNADAEYHYKTIKDEAAVFDFEGVLTAKRFFNYKGSLTTPGCDEAVMWYVMQEANFVSTAQLNAFRTALDFSGELARVNALYPKHKLRPFQVYGNNRPTQPLHGRTLRISTDFQPAPVVEINPAPVYANDDSPSKSAIAGLVIGCIGLVVALAAVALAAKGGGGKSAAPTPAAETEPAAEPTA